MGNSSPKERGPTSKANDSPNILTYNRTMVRKAVRPIEANDLRTKGFSINY